MKLTVKSKTAAILKRDFDNAVKKEWSGRTCIIAQTGRRIKRLSGRGLDLFIDSVTTGGSRAIKAMSAFDRCFRSPGDEKKAELQKLRASLPIKICLS